jgi:hypothetical protein
MIYEGLGAAIVRPDAEPIYIHNGCNKLAREESGEQGKDQQAIVLKCIECGSIVAEFPDEAQMQHDLSVWLRQKRLQ